MLCATPTPPPCPPSTPTYNNLTTTPNDSILSRSLPHLRHVRSFPLLFPGISPGLSRRLCAHSPRCWEPNTALVTPLFSPVIGIWLLALPVLPAPVPGISE